jgi:WD40 repeat protein
VDGVDPQHALIDLRRALMVGAAAVFVAASWALAGGGQTIAEARAVVYGQQAFASPNGRTLATATENGTVQLWDVRSDTRIGTLKGLSGIVDSVAFSPSGRIVAAGGSDEVVLLWDVPSRSQLGTALKAHAGSVYSVAFSPDGRTLAAGSANGTVLLWDVRTHARLGTLRSHAIISVAFSPNGRTLAAGSASGTVLLWDVRSQCLTLSWSRSWATRAGAGRPIVETGEIARYGVARSAPRPVIRGDSYP